LLMEWSYEQLVAAGSTEKLLKYKMPVPNRSRRDSRRPPMNLAALERIEDTHRE
jgi:hypothetical protein